MKKKDVEFHGLYWAKVSGQRVVVRLEEQCDHGGWHATNTETGRRIRIRTAARLTPYVEAK